VKSLRLLVVAALGTLVSACVTSETPKFSPSSAVPALGSGGDYSLWEHSGGKYYAQGSLTARLRPDGLYEFLTDEEPISISFHDLGNGLIVGQANITKIDYARGTYGYMILTRKDADVFLHLVQCDAQPPDLLAAHRVDVRAEQNTCSIDGVIDPAKFFAALPAGEPTFKMVPK
jgi:hypothetical protein